MTLFPGLTNAERNVRRRAMQTERKERASGQWAELKQYQVAADTVTGGDPRSWLLDVHTVFRNEWCVVMVRDCKTSIGFVRHASIRTASETTLSWDEKQRVKNLLFGNIAVAVEVFPATDNEVTAAPMSHLWILPLDFKMPFGIGPRDPTVWNGYRP